MSPALDPGPRTRAAGRLPRRFAARMLPTALLAGLALALLPPVSYWVVAGHGLEDQAGIYARHLALAVRDSAIALPRLWRYDVGKVVQMTAAFRGQQDIARVRVFDCSGHTIFEPRRLSLGTGGAGAEASRAPVVVHGVAVGHVEVVMDAGPRRQRAVALAVVSTILGFGLALLLFFYPSGVVGELALALGRSVARLEEAEQQLKDANTGLEEQVAAAVSEVRALSSRVVEVQEEERGRIARDLHDGVGQALTALQIELRLADGEGAPVERRKRAQDIVRDTVAEIRRVVSDLRPGELERLGLLGALRAASEAVEARSGVPVAFRCEGDLSGMSSALGTALYRMLQECLHNALRHAQPQEIGVRLIRTPGGVQLRVEDDGCGFDTAAHHPGAGLRGLHERARFLGGEAHIESTVGEGTVVDIRLPVQEG